MIEKDSMFGIANVTKSERYLHTPSSFAKQNLYYLQEAGKLHSLIPHRCIREKLDSFLFFLVLEGQGTLTICNEEYVLKKGNCVLLDCKEHYEHISEENNGWKLAWVHFNGHSVRGFYDLYVKSNYNSNVFKMENFSNILEIVEKLIGIEEEKSLLFEMKCNELLASLLRVIYEKVMKTVETVNEIDKERLHEVREYLNHNFATANVLEDFESIFLLPLEMVQRIFRSHFGISMEEYISNRRFLTAKELLRFSVKPIVKIAKESGFQDVIVMQQMFYDKENMSAEEYRSKWAHWIRQ